ncbi:MAG: winged helix-turn-helix domain-containing protein [Colwellia sp.]|nr:winged helix-turn-helix domain-containing protein [Colwellia sp.]
MIKQFSKNNFSFLGVDVVPQANLIIKNSREKRLEPKVMYLLVLFATRGREVITRAEILEELWPNVVVGDEVISQLVYGLRNALGDDAKKPKYIETIPKKGYRFIPEVKFIESNESSNLATDVDLDVLKNKPKSSLKTISLLFSIVLLTFLTTWYANTGFPSKGMNLLTIKNILPVTQTNGVEGDFSFHKNHNQMVYVSTGKQGTDLYLKTLGNSQSQQITNDEWLEYSPLWLNEQTLIYIRKKATQYQIISQNMNNDIEIHYESTNGIFNLVIKSNELSEVIFTEYDNYKHNKLYELKSLNISNNKVEYLHDSILKLPSDIRNVVYSLDGQRLYFFNNDDKVKQIVSLDLTSNKYTTISKEFAWVEHIALLDSEHLLISGVLSATKGIWQLNISDHSIKSVLASSSGERIVRSIIKQEQLYYSTYKASTNQMIADTKSKTFDELPKLNSDANEYSGIFSKDNNSIFFVSNRTGYYELWLYDVESKNVLKISDLQASFIQKPILSHNEEYLAVVYEKEGLTLAIISVETGEIINETKIPNMKYPLAWSANDKSLYISEHRGDVNIYRYDWDSLKPTLIQKRAGLFAEENTDSKSLVLIDYELGGLVNKSLIDEDTKLLNNSIMGLESLIPGQLKVVGQSIFALQKDGSTRELQQYSLENIDGEHSGKFLMNLPDKSSVTDFNIDGSKAIFTYRAQAQGDIMRVLLGH